MSGVISPYALGLALQKSTGPAGFALQNGTPTILSWTAPSDGQLHRIFVIGSGVATVAETGGGVNVNYALPNGNVTPFPLLIPGGQGAGYIAAGYVAAIVGSGAVVTVQQGSALTAGAAILWAEIWGS